eukprot:4903597-Lingulodinium_polyedra.AAC.1
MSTTSTSSFAAASLFDCSIFYRARIRLFRRLCLILILIAFHARGIVQIGQPALEQHAKQRPSST